MTEPIVVERHIDAPPDTVYRFLTDSEKWARWQGARATIDATPGGLFGINMATGQRARGEFVELIPNKRVVFTWGWIDHPGVPPGSSTVEIDLTSTNGGTLVTLTHHGLPPEEIDLHRLGWDHYMPRLANVAEGSDPGADPGPG